MHNISKVFPNKLIDFKFEGKSDRRIQLGNASYSGLKYCYGLNHPMTQIYDVSIGTRNLCLVGIPVRITFSILASNSSNITCNFMNHVTWRDRNNITFLLVLVTYLLSRHLFICALLDESKKVICHASQV